MAIIYRITDRIEIKIDDFKIKIRPMTIAERSQVVEALSEAQKSNSVAKINEASLIPIRICLKGLDGVQDSNGEPYQLQFEDDGLLTEECLSDLLSMGSQGKIAEICMGLLNGIPEKLQIEGVEFAKPSAKKKK